MLIHWQENAITTTFDLLKTSSVHKEDKPYPKTNFSKLEVQILAVCCGGAEESRRCKKKF
jgi:hypothetical protein